MKKHDIMKRIVIYQASSSSFSFLLFFSLIIMVSVDRGSEFWSTVFVLSNKEISKPQRHLDSRYCCLKCILMIRLEDPLYSLCVTLTKNLNSIKSDLNELKQKSKKRDLFTNSSKELNELQTFIYNKLEEYSKDLETMHEKLNSSKVLLFILSINIYIIVS